MRLAAFTCMQHAGRFAIILAMALTAERVAWACHSSPCPSEIPTSAAVGFVADTVFLAIDLHYASRDARPSRVYGAVELVSALIQVPVALGSMLHEGHDYYTAAELQLAGAAVVGAHALYVLIRGEKPAHRLSITPTVQPHGGGLTFSGRF